MQTRRGLARLITRECTSTCSHNSRHAHGFQHKFCGTRWNPAAESDGIRTAGNVLMAGKGYRCLLLKALSFLRNSQWRGFPNFIFCLMLSFPKYVTMRKQRQKLCKVCSFADVGWYVDMPSHGHLEARRDIPVTQRDMPVSLT